MWSKKNTGLGLFFGGNVSGLNMVVVWGFCRRWGRVVIFFKLYVKVVFFIVIFGESFFKFFRFEFVFVEVWTEM